MREIQEEKKLHPQLPKLREDEKNLIANFSQRGKWDIRTEGELDKLSESISIDQIDMTYHDVDSIPDIWARPILFETALYDEFHLLHNRTLGEWRGLLTLIALKEYRELPIEIIKLEIPAQKISPLISDVQKKDELAKQSVIPEFLRVLRDIPKPVNKLSTDTDWDKIYVILFHKNPIGILSPSTLVCTASDCYNRISNVSWFDGKFLKDPIAYKQKQGDQEKRVINRSESIALAGFINEIKSKISNHPEINTEYNNLTKLTHLLTQFSEDILKPFQRDILAGNIDISFQPSENNYNLQAAGLFKYMDCPAKVVRDTVKTSHVRLKCSRSPEPPISLLLIDKEIANTWNLPPQDIIVYGAITLGSFPFEGPGSDQTKIGRKNLVNAKWMTPDMFFTERFSYVAFPDAFPGAQKINGSENLRIDGQPITPILPIKSELLNYLTLDDLYNRVSLEIGTNDEIKCKIRFPLMGIKPDNINEMEWQGYDFEYIKEYKRENGTLHKITEVPVIAVWPNFICDKWKAYYTFWSKEGAATFCAKPYPQITDEKSIRNIYISNKLDGQISCLTTFPEAFICESEAESKTRKGFEKFEAGLILLQPPEKKTPAKQWSVGVDFGTSATNVYFSEDGSTPKALTFNKRTLKIAESSARHSSVYKKFFPVENEETPFQTVYQLFKEALSATESPRQILDGNIYFVKQHNDFDYNQHELTTIITDLKWGPTHGIRVTKAFLQQLCMMCAAEAVAQNAWVSEWHYSFPTAFSPKERESLRIAWDDIQSEANKSWYIPDKKVLSAPASKPESIASAQYFADNSELQKEISFGREAVCIDIGGGTSDISIWLENKLVWQSSLRFASRNIFLEALRMNPYLLEYLGIPEKDTQRLKNISSNPTSFYAITEAMLNEKDDSKLKKGDSWLNKLHEFPEEKIVQEFIQLLALALSGMLFYIGQVLRYLREKEQKNIESPNFYLAGNGAKMFHWLALGKFDSNSSINTLFKNCIREGAKLPTRNGSFNVFVSRDLKAEAAFGLIIGTTKLVIEDYDPCTDQRVIAGEFFTEHGNKIEPIEPINAARLCAGIKRPPKLEQFEKFIDIFNRFAKSPVSTINALEVDELLFDHLLRRIDQFLANCSQSDEREVHVEPLFIFLLRECLYNKIQKWASKYANK